MIRRSLFALALLGLLATQIAAQEAEPPEEMNPILQEVVAKFDAGEDEEALALLESLRQQEDPPVVGMALLGALYVKLGRPLDALDLLEPLAAAESPDAAVLYNAGLAAAALGQMQRAAEFYQQSVEIMPASPARRELGLLLGGQGMYPQALAMLKPWAEMFPADVEVRLAAAFCAVQLERVPDAEVLLSDLPQDQPQVSLLWGRVLLIKGDPWGAINTLTPVLDRAPDAMQLDIRRELAEAHAAVGQASEAVAILAEYSERDPSVALQLALAQYQSGEIEDALASLRPFAEGLVSSSEMPPDVDLAARMVLHYGRFLAMTGAHEAALPYLELATRMSPDEKQGWQMLGQTLAGLGRRDEAQVALERFQEITKGEVSASKQDLRQREERDDPTLAAMREAFEMVAEERYEDALARVRQERAIARNDLRPMLLEGRMLTVLQRLDEAMEVAELAIRTAPDNADAVYLRGSIHMAMGSLDAAEADFRQALAVQPDHTATMNDLAVLLIDRGQPLEARQLLEQVLERNPDDQIAAENLASIEG